MTYGESCTRRAGAAEGGAREDLADIVSCFDELWPLLRSITGGGVRMTLDILSDIASLERIEVPTGTEVFDWTVPPEWVVRDAYVITPDGHRILDVRANNLHLLNYSESFRGVVSRQALDAHLYSLPDQPDAIPYVTSYYERRWGFCLSHHQRELLPEGDYEVVIDTEHVDGALSIGEAVLPGERRDEVLISTYTCHPSLANNELSGPLVAAFLCRRLASWPSRRFTYRFVFAPETIGAIAYLALKGEHLREHLLAGYVVTCVGLDEPFTLKRSRRGDTLADRAAAHVLQRRTDASTILDFYPTGSDERQYCSPGFNLPVAVLTRLMPGAYPEYHTSLDNRDLISFPALQESIDVYEQVLSTIDANARYRNLSPFGEPQLSPRGLYRSVGNAGPPPEPLFWLLNLADGEHDLLAIAERSGQPVEALAEAAAACIGVGLVAEDAPTDGRDPPGAI